MATYRENNIQLHQSCCDFLSMLDFCTSSLCPMFVILGGSKRHHSNFLGFARSMLGKSSNMLSQMVVYRWFTLEEPVKTSQNKSKKLCNSPPPFFPGSLHSKLQLPPREKDLKFSKVGLFRPVTIHEIPIGSMVMVCIYIYTIIYLHWSSHKNQPFM